MNATSSPPGAASAPARPLSEQLALLRETFADGVVTLRDVIGTLEARAYALVMILFVLPFVAPASIPGLSTPLGLAVAFIAVQLAVGRQPWLPRRLLDRPLPSGAVGKFVTATQRVVRTLEKVLHPRMPLLSSTAAVRALHLIAIAVAALLLALPMPIPFTNTFPGWTILLFACGLLERDGVFILGGYLMLLATCVFFLLLGSAITEALQHTLAWFAR